MLWLLFGWILVGLVAALAIGYLAREAENLAQHEIELCGLVPTRSYRNRKQIRIYSD